MPSIKTLSHRILQIRPLTSSHPLLRLLHLQSEHKVLHKTGKNNLLQTLKDFTSPIPLPTDPVTGTFDPFPSFQYTGTLRPTYPLSPKRIVPSHIKRPDYAEYGTPRSEYALGSSRKVSILSPSECQGMRKVCRLAREVLDIAAAAVRPGITTDEIDEIVHKACIERNVRPPLPHVLGLPTNGCSPTLPR